MKNCQLPETINVEIDIELLPIIPDFLERRQGDCIQISKFLQEGAFKEIHTLGHRMKGAGGSFGFDEISEIGEILENAALVPDHNSISTAVQRLSDYLERIEVVYV